MQRIPEISVMQTLGVIFVCVFHSMAGVAEYSFPYRWIHIFVIPLFFYLSGYLFCYTRSQERTLTQFVSHKSYRLLLPYFVISTLVFVPKSFLSTYAMRPTDFSLSGYLRMLLMPYDNVIVYYWFIPTLYVVLLLFYLLFHYLPTSVLRAPIMLPFFVLLYFVNPIASLWVLNIGEAVECLSFFAFGYYSCVWQLPMLMRRHIGVLFVSSFLLLSLSVLFHGNPLFDFIGAVMGIVMCQSLASLYLRSGYSFLNHLEGAYFTIYLLSWFPQVAVNRLLLWGGNIYVHPCIAFFLALLSGIYIPLLVHRLYTRWSDQKG